jgi:hypothetical protein
LTALLQSTTNESNDEIIIGGVECPHDNDTNESNDEIMIEGVECPYDNDILLGRGGKNNKHIGNAKFRLMALDRVEMYKKCSKTEKTGMVNELVAAVRNLDPPGRFLRRVSSGLWFDAGTKFAKEKASQVFRDALDKKYNNSNKNKNKTKRNGDVQNGFLNGAEISGAEISVPTDLPPLDFESLSRRINNSPSGYTYYFPSFPPLASLQEEVSQLASIQELFNNIQDTHEGEVQSRRSSLPDLQNLGGSYRNVAPSIASESTVYTQEHYDNLKDHTLLPTANQTVHSTLRTESCTIESTQEGAYEWIDKGCDFNITHSQYKVMDMNLEPIPLDSDETFNLAEISSEEISDLFIDEELTLRLKNTPLTNFL